MRIISFAIKVKVPHTDVFVVVYSHMTDGGQEITMTTEER